MPLRSMHHLLRFMNMCLIGFFNVLTLLLATGLFVVPLYGCVSIFTHMFIWSPLAQKFLRFIKVRNPRNDETVYLTLDEYSDAPHDLLFDLKVKASLKRIGSTSLVSILFLMACTFTYFVVTFSQSLHDSLLQHA